MAGVWLEQAFPVYPQGFPAEVMREFEEKIGRKTIGNKPASGTEILKELGDEHVRTGKPIVYTSGDSVFQIAAHEDVIPVAELYRMCEIARKILDGKHRVGRVIARPFQGTSGNYKRTERRHDYAVDPPRPMLLDVLEERSAPLFGIGKIHDIYNGRGVEEYVTTKSNADGMEKIAAATRERPRGLIFCNLVDFDMLYGHRKDVEGFARSLELFDEWLGGYLGELREKDLLLITADHGCDPDPRWPTTDHSREYVPILAYRRRSGSRSGIGSAGNAGRHGADGGGDFWREDTAREKFSGEIRRLKSEAASAWSAAGGGFGSSGGGTRSVVAIARASDELAFAVRSDDVDVNATVTAIARGIGRIVGKGVLVADVVGDLLADGVDVVHILREKGLAAGSGSDFG